jgi:hypothetical protein
MYLKLLLSSDNMYLLIVYLHLGLISQAFTAVTENDRGRGNNGTGYVV